MARLGEHSDLTSGSASANSGSYEAGMFVKVNAAVAMGVEAMPIEVEVDGSRGLVQTQIVGLPDKAVNEAKERVRTAIENGGYDFPMQRLTINLAPADVKKEGPSFDLPIAVGILAVSHQVNPDAVGRYAMVGELALDGRVRAVNGVLPIVMALRDQRYKSVIVPQDNAAEAGLVEGINVYPVSHLREVVGLLNGSLLQEPYVTETEEFFSYQQAPLAKDFSEVMGQESIKRAVVVAAAGGHNMLMIGNPGVGKSMIASRIPGILPRMTLEEAVATTKVHSCAGKLSKDRPLVCARPYRSPHHTVSDVGMVGGGANPRPGEVSLSHHGVLFLDELPEFNRKTLEVLRQPLEDGTVTITRAAGSYTFPAQIMLVAAMNPCPCGYLGHPKRQCTDSPRQVASYRNRISGPLLDRIDIQVEVPNVEFHKLHSDAKQTDSATMAKQVREARAIQTKRYDGLGVSANAHMSDRMINEFVTVTHDGKALLETAMNSLSLSPRAYTRIKKVARTIADIEGERDVNAQHISEAIAYRSLDRS